MLSNPRPHRARGGFWATVGWGLLIYVASLVVNIIAIFAAAFLGAFDKPLSKLTAAEISHNGFALALATLAALPVLCGLILLIAKLRRKMSLRDYLGLRWPNFRTLLRWSLGFIILVAASDTTTALLGKDVVAPFMVEAYKTAKIVPLLWLAILVAAPLGEEFLFRGFIFEGFRHSRLGAPGAIILTAFFWAGLHLQYDVYGIGSIVLGGLFLGYTRLRTGSVWLCVCLHALMNLIATIELLIYLA